MSFFFGSVITAMVTPFKDNYEVDYNKVEELAEFLIDKGSDSLVVTGTTGESPTLTDEEKINLYKTVLGVVRGKAKVIAGTGVNSTLGTIEISRKAEEIGVDGIMLVTPYYNKPPQEGLYKHFKTVSEAISLPIILYNVPGRTGINIASETTLKLAEIDNIIGIKEASGDLGQVSSICASAPEKFVVYSGDDYLTLPMLSIGAKGVISIASHFVGNDIKKMINSFFAGEISKAAKIHQDLFPLFKGLFMTTNPIPLKAALNMMGIKVGNPRLPLNPLSEDLWPAMHSLLRSYGLV